MRRSSAFPWTYVESWLSSRDYRDTFDSVQRYVMFIGQPRSGTSLLGSLLNAHPDMCVAQELNALRYVRRGYNREQLFWLLIKRDGDFARSNRNWTGYDYNVDGQWQGRLRNLRVIGDKKAGLSTDQLRANPKLLDKLIDVVKVPVKIVHVVRDPFNVITTVHRRRKISLESSAEIYFRRCETNWKLMNDLGPMVHTLRLEELIAQPKQHLRALCEFLDVESGETYIDSCAQVLFSKPRQSKSDSNWPSSLISSVSKQVESFPLLEGYEYDHAPIAKAA